MITASPRPLNRRSQWQLSKAEPRASYRAPELHVMRRAPLMEFDRARTPYTPFRRNPDGSLCMPSALAKVFEGINAIGFPGGMDATAKAALHAVMPEICDCVDDPLAQRAFESLSDGERVALRILMRAKLAEAENYNAGRGGGSVPGRSMTRRGIP